MTDPMPASDRDLPVTLARSWFRPRTVLLLFALGLLLRIALVATSIGTNDVLFKTFWAELIEKHGVIGAYSLQDTINASGLKIALFPPLTLLTFKLMIFVSKLTEIAYTDVFRLFQSAADVLTFGCLYLIAGRIRQAERHSIALFFFLCPAAIFISAFHCNTDSTMVALIVASIAILPVSRYGAATSGVLLAAATGIKVLPLFLAPFFVVALVTQRRAHHFLGGWITGIIAIYAPAAILGGNDVVHRILSYSGYISDWGISGSLLTLRYVLNVGQSSLLLDLAILYYEQGKYVVIAAQALFLLWFGIVVLRNRQQNPQEMILRATAVVFLLSLFWAPGFGVQYLVWPVAFLPFALGWRDSLVIATAFSVLLFATYTTWSGGFPWWYADSTTATKTNLLIGLGTISWLLTGYGAWKGIARLGAASDEALIRDANPNWDDEGAPGV